MAETKDLKMQVTVNKEISSIEKSTTNLDLALDRQINERRENIITGGMNITHTQTAPCTL